MVYEKTKSVVDDNGTYEVFVSKIAPKGESHRNDIH